MATDFQLTPIYDQLILEQAEQALAHLARDLEMSVEEERQLQEAISTPEGRKQVTSASANEAILRAQHDSNVKRFTKMNKTKLRQWIEDHLDQGEQMPPYSTTRMELVRAALTINDQMLVKAIEAWNKEKN